MADKVTLRRFEASRLDRYRVAWKAAFGQTAKALTGLSGYSGALINALPLALMMSWIAARSERAEVISYTYWGGFFVVVWYNSIFRMQEVLGQERTSATLEHNLLAPTPLWWLMFGKSSAVMLFCLLSASAALLLMFAVAGRSPVVGHPLFLTVSFLIELLAVFSLSFVFVPLMTLFQASGAFYVGIRPIGMLLSGFFVPISELPQGIALAASSLPTSWAMQGLNSSIIGNDDDFMIRALSLSMVLSAAYVALAVFLFKVVEARILSTGTARVTRI